LSPEGHSPHVRDKGARGREPDSALGDSGSDGSRTAGCPSYLIVFSRLS